MNMNQTEQDILKLMFKQIPEEALPPTFQSDMMVRIRQEAIHISVRNKRLRMTALIAASVATIGLAIAALIYVGIPQFQIVFPSITLPSYYLYFGFLVTVLLLADYLLRQSYDRRHQKS
jgi:hypothetical protein